MTLKSRLVSQSRRHGRTLALTSLFVLSAAASVTACGGSSNSELGKSPPGGAADAGQGGDGSPGAGGTANGSGGTIIVGDRGGKGGATSGSGASGGSDAGAGDGTTGGTSGSAGSGAIAGTAGLPAKGTTQCSDGIDNDGDGLIDGLDPECTGPWDDDEGSFATGIPGDNKDPKWQDCFFDGNSGAGDDRCRYPTTCLTGELSPDDPKCAVTQQCVDNCGAATPNGCDCFGCCSVQLADGSSVDILEASTCSIATIDDDKACPRCSKSTKCQNTCGECELCPGKTVADLPASCTPPDTGTGGTSGAGGSSATGGSSGSDATGGTSGTGNPPPPPRYTCDGGEQVCGPGLAACPEGLYCSLGCCTVVVR